MHKNTASRCLRWWTQRGVLKGTAQLRSSTIYQIEEHPPGAIEPNIPPQVMLYPSPGDVEPESNITPEVIQYPSPSDAISLPECSNITSEGGLKERKENVNEQDKTNNTQQGVRELHSFLEMLPEPKREKAIRDALDKWPKWAQSWPHGLKDAIPYYLVVWEAFKVDILARVGTQELEHA